RSRPPRHLSCGNGRHQWRVAGGKDNRVVRQAGRVNNNRTNRYRTADENHRSRAGFSNRGSDQRRPQSIVESEAESDTRSITRVYTELDQATHATSMCGSQAYIYSATPLWGMDLRDL
ncbi:unnamed protein product, partial [Staurois parvus]